jgi:voltage-gated potassium channel
MDLERRTHLYARVERATELPMLVLAAAMAPLILVPLLVDLPSTVEWVMFVCDWVIWGAFAVELGVKTYLSPDRRRYLISHWYDVLIVVLPFLRPLRLLRLVAAFSRMGLTSKVILGRRGLGYVLIFGVLSMVGIAGLVLVFEQQDGSALITNFPTALWWAAATVTTVGYGEIVPITWAGRGLGVVLMIVGIGLFGVFTANVAAFFVEDDKEQAASEDRAALLSEVRALRDELADLRRTMDGAPGG